MYSRILIIVTSDEQDEIWRQKEAIISANISVSIQSLRLQKKVNIVCISSEIDFKMPL
jgi:hypothetical protein